eukprot:RCo021202
MKMMSGARLPRLKLCCVPFLLLGLVLTLNASHPRDSSSVPPVGAELRLWPPSCDRPTSSDKVPYLKAYITQQSTSKAAFVVCPGGSYTKHSLPAEGFPVVKWLNSLGISVFLLLYRLPAEHGSHAPLQDGTRALELLLCGRPPCGRGKPSPRSPLR